MGNTQLCLHIESRFCQEIINESQEHLLQEYQEQARFVMKEDVHTYIKEKGKFTVFSAFDFNFQ